MSAKLMTRRQAAEYLNTSVSTVIRLQADGKLAPVRLRKGGQVHYHVDDVERLLRTAQELTQ